MDAPWTLDQPLKVDRAAERRKTADLAQAHAVIVSDGSVLMRGEHVALLEPADRPDAELEVYLGRHQGRDVVAVVPRRGHGLNKRSTEGGAPNLVPLWQALDDLGARGDLAVERELAATAVAMAVWHERNPMCSLCGVPTEVCEAGWLRKCPDDGRDHYPRTDPAVIVSITDADDRLLLSHVSYHSSRRYTHLAGYVEPGESLEQAAHREIFEESRLEVEDLAYVGSQPWPFPASIMVAFTARAKATEFTVDGEEVVDAKWFTREELTAQVADGTIVLAPPGSIARKLVHDWFGGPVEEEGDVSNA